MSTPNRSETWREYQRSLFSKRRQNPIHRPFWLSTFVGGVLLGLALMTQSSQAGGPPPYAFSITSAQVAGGFSPGALATDDAGNIYAISGSMVVQFAPDGTYLNQWGGNGTGPGQFTAVGSVAADHAGGV